MADGLWAADSNLMDGMDYVLILVLMADGLWAALAAGVDAFTVCLNPCSNGRWSMSRIIWSRISSSWVLILVLMADGLWGAKNLFDLLLLLVLILVLMADGLWVREDEIWVSLLKAVLILVLMADGLWVEKFGKRRLPSRSLNPCSNGRWSMR